MMRRVGLAVGGVVMLSCLVGCGSKPLVGVLLPITGTASTYGESIESGIRLAINDSRERGEVPEGFDVVWADTTSDPRLAVDELRKMAVERGINLIIGGATSGEAQAMIPVLDELDVVLLSPSASTPGLSQRSKLFFRIYPSDQLEGHTAARFLIDKMDEKRVILYAGDSDYVRGIEPEFRQQFEKALGGRVVARIDLTDPEWPAQSKAVLRAEPESAVFIIEFAETILEVLRHLDEQGFEGRRVTTSAFYSSRVIRDAGDLAEGILFPLPPFDRTSEKEPVEGFVNRYMDTYQRAPDVFAAHGYDALRLAVEVMNIARPPETTNIRRALLIGITDFMGVTGPILFDDHGDVKHYPKMFVVKDAQVVSHSRYLKAERARIHREVLELLDKD
jgi:branched-chain amino acid transport system substrate-binding protein